MAMHNYIDNGLFYTFKCYTKDDVVYKEYKIHSYSSEVQTFIYLFIYIVWKGEKEGIDRTVAEHRNKTTSIIQEIGPSMTNEHTATRSWFRS